MQSYKICLKHPTPTTLSSTWSRLTRTDPTTRRLTMCSSTESSILLSSWIKRATVVSLKRMTQKTRKWVMLTLLQTTRLKTNLWPLTSFSLPPCSRKPTNLTLTVYLIRAYLQRTNSSKNKINLPTTRSSSNLSNINLVLSLGRWTWIWWWVLISLSTKTLGLLLKMIARLTLWQALEPLLIILVATLS
jgi:hypothetical protein